jgi:hypothetical protein
MNSNSDIRWKQRFRNFDRAFVLLRDAMENGPSALNPLEKEGVIHRFEYCFELGWKCVKDYLEAGGLVLVMVFAPAGSPEARSMPNRTERPKMTVGQAALIVLMDRYLKGLLDPFVSLLEIHKLLYFLQSAGQPLRLRYEARTFGPYARNLRQVLIRLEKHYTQGYGDGKDTPTKPIELLPGAVEEAESFLVDDELIRQRMERVTQLIEGFEDPYGLELLSSVHWVMRDNLDARNSAESAVSAVHRWNPRKRRIMKPEHLTKAWRRLKAHHWDHCFATA